MAAHAPNTTSTCKQHTAHSAAQRGTVWGGDWRPAPLHPALAPAAAPLPGYPPGYLTSRLVLYRSCATSWVPSSNCSPAPTAPAAEGGEGDRELPLAAAACGSSGGSTHGTRSASSPSYN